MKALITTGTATLALFLASCGGEGEGNMVAAGDTSPVASIPAPNGGDWTKNVTETPAGGYVMGNPEAPVKVVEYASLTCNHCAAFAETGIPALTDKYVKTGQVSLEIRNFVRDPADIAAALLTRCGGATPYFQLTEQMFGAQEEWIGRLQTMSPADQQQLQALSPQQAVAAMGEQAGLIDFVRLRGIPAEKARQCLADEAEFNQLVEMAQAATTEYPNFPGTPTFIINGERADNAGTWELLEPKIQQALR